MQPRACLNAQPAYGIRLQMSDTSTVYGAGLRYQLDDSLDLDLTTSHRQRSSGNHDNRLFLQLPSDF